MSCDLISLFDINSRQSKGTGKVKVRQVQAQGAIRKSVQKGEVSEPSYHLCSMFYLPLNSSPTGFFFRLRYLRRAQHVALLAQRSFSPQS